MIEINKIKQKTVGSIVLNQDRFFDTESLKTDLKGHSIRGGMVTMVAQGIKLCFSIGSTVILARLLTPQDYGLIAMVTVVTGFVAMFKDMGLSMATVQKANINHGQISTLFWVNVAISFVLMILTAAIAPAIALFYHEPRLTSVTLALAGAFIFGGLTIQHQALLRRQMQFGTLALIDVVSMLVGFVIAIVLAWYGASYWALVFMHLSVAITTAIGVWVACRWRPGLPVRGSGVRPMLAFGGHLTGFSFVNYFARNMDNILIGKFCGSASLGLYSRAYKLMMLPITNIRNPINSVALPALSRLQNDAISYRSYYSKLVSVLAFINMPLIVLLFVFSDDIIRLILGEKWYGVSLIFKILTFTAFIQPVFTTVGLVFTSLGQTKRQLKWGVCYSTAIVVAFFVGLPWGPVGVASAYSIVNYVIIFPSLWYAFKFTPISISIVVSAVLHSTISSLVMGMVVFVSRCYLIDQPKLVSIVISLLVGIFAFFFVWLLIPRGKEILYEYKSFLVSLMQKKNAL